MERSLAALLPVRNVQATLAATVLEWLEVLAELTRHVEVLVVDDCSCDATIEVADELLSQYPQLRVIRHPEPLGRSAALETAFARSRGEIVFFADEDCELTIDEARMLWLPLDRYDVVLGRPKGGAPHWERWTGCWESGFQMGFRAAFEPLRQAMGDQRKLLDELTRQGARWLDVEVSLRKPRLAPHRTASLAKRLYAGRIDPAAVPRPTGGKPAAASPPKRPNYLARLKEFALGE